jgi:hypothetical protein
MACVEASQARSQKLSHTYPGSGVRWQVRKQRGRFDLGACIGEICQLTVDVGPFRRSADAAATCSRAARDRPQAACPARALAADIGHSAARRRRRRLEQGGSLNTPGVRGRAGTWLETHSGGGLPVLSARVRR